MREVETIQNVPFGSRSIGVNAPVLVIAEVGINHEGDVDLCAQMIEDAHQAGADSVKLQTIDADANYAAGSPSHELFGKSALSQEETARMFSLIRSLGMEPFTTVGDVATLEWVEALEPTAYKISSGLMTHTPMLEHLLRTKRPILLSTGMADMGEIDEAVKACENAPGGFGLFHCTSLYPAPPETLNLSMIPYLKERYGHPVGFSDHSLGIEAAQLSVTAGAVMIEKHFSFDTFRPGYDHPISLDKKGFSDMVQAVRQAEVMRGSAPKVLSAEEVDIARRSHRVLVALKDIQPGDVLNEKNLGFKRPVKACEGVPPGEFKRYVGRTATVEIPKDGIVTAGNTRD